MSILRSTSTGKYDIEHRMSMLGMDPSKAVMRADGTIDYDGDLTIGAANADTSTIATTSSMSSTARLTEMPFVFHEVNGCFDCSNNSLTTLRGAPVIVHGYFKCSFNRLTSLEGGPLVVDKEYIAYHNKISSLKGAPIVVHNTFDVSWNMLTTLDGGPLRVVRNDGNNIPYYIDNRSGIAYYYNFGMNVQHNYLAGLMHAPCFIDGDFDCSHNEIASLEGVSKCVTGSLYLSNQHINNGWSEYASWQTDANKYLVEHKVKLNRIFF